MGGTGVIDHFLEVFTRYIDGGFGLLGGEVGFIATTLIVIDVTLAALFWSWGADDNIIARLVKKTLFVGIFAYLISNWNNLARIIFESFAGLGLKASGTGFAVSDLMRPGKVAQTGLDAGRYRIVFASIDPGEQPEDARAARRKLADALPSADLFGGGQFDIRQVLPGLANVLHLCRACFLSVQDAGFIPEALGDNGSGREHDMGVVVTIVPCPIGRMDGGIHRHAVTLDQPLRHVPDQPLPRGWGQFMRQGHFQLAG